MTFRAVHLEYLEGKFRPGNFDPLTWTGMQNITKETAVLFPCDTISQHSVIFPLAPITYNLRTISRESNQDTQQEIIRVRLESVPVFAPISEV